MRSFIIGVILCTLTASLAGADNKKSEPELEVKARPQTQFKRPDQRSVNVTVNISIKNANEEWWCSPLGIFWGDGESSIIEPSCNYFEEAPEDEIKRTRYTRDHDYRYRGDFTIVVILAKGEDKIAEKKVNIRIR